VRISRKNVMLIAMMQNIARTNHQQRRADRSGTNEQETMEIGGNNQQDPISGTIQQNDDHND